MFRSSKLTSLTDTWSSCLGFISLNVLPTCLLSKASCKQCDFPLKIGSISLETCYITLLFSLLYSISCQSCTIIRACFSCFKHAIVECMRLAFFKIFSSFVHFCVSFQMLCTFWPFFWKIACMPLLSRIGPDNIMACNLESDTIAIKCCFGMWQHHVQCFL